MPVPPRDPVRNIEGSISIHNMKSVRIHTPIIAKVLHNSEANIRIKRVDVATCFNHLSMIHISSLPVVGNAMSIDATKEEVIPSGRYSLIAKIIIGNV
jgi:hypothetical protein